jgi:hypothetical protein
VSPEEEITRAQEAERLLAHPLMKEAFETIQKEVIERWQNSPAADANGREKLWLTFKLLQRLKTHLESVMASGKLAEATLRQRLLGRARSNF